MGSNSPTPLTTIPVKTPGEAIAFLQHIRGGCRQRCFEWWINLALNTFASDAARVAAAAHLARAMRIDDLMQQNLDTMLQQAPVQGIRLNMNVRLVGMVYIAYSCFELPVTLNTLGIQTLQN
jgi:hypothetical protein